MKCSATFLVSAAGAAAENSKGVRPEGSAAIAKSAVLNPRTVTALVHVSRQVNAL